MCVFEMETKMENIKKTFLHYMLLDDISGAIKSVKMFIDKFSCSDFEEQCIIENCREVLETLKA